MRRNFLPILGLLSLFVLGSCSAERDPKIASLKHAIGVADSQLLDAAAELDTTNCFPRSLMPRFRAVDAKDWTSGFFPGSLWQCYRFTGDEKLLAEAEKYTGRLEGIQYYKGTHDLGFMVFCSFGQQMQTLHDRHSEAVIVEAAKSLVSRCDPRIGLIRSWDFGEWNYPVIIDNMMNLEMLFTVSKLTGDKRYYDIAVCHADNTLKNHFRPDNSCFHIVCYDAETGRVTGQRGGQGYSAASAWSRGQSWALYGFTMCYRETGDPSYLDRAVKCAEYFINHPRLPEDLVPYWDYDAPGIPDEPRDASALLELAKYAPGKEKSYYGTARKILTSLASDRYLIPAGKKCGFLIDHSVGSKPSGSQVDVPIIYGDYYFLEALLRLKNYKTQK